MTITYEQWMQKSVEDRKAEVAKRIRQCSKGAPEDRIAVVLTPADTSAPTIPQFRYLLKDDDRLVKLYGELRKALIKLDDTRYNEMTAVYFYAVSAEKPETDRALVATTATMRELHADYARADGFVHLQYALENCFGADA